MKVLWCYLFYSCRGHFLCLKLSCLFNTHSGLKHVSDTQKTHKNPQLRSQAGPVQTGPKPFSAAPRPTATATPARTLPPVLELEGKKWKVVSGKNSHEICGINVAAIKDISGFVFCLLPTSQFLLAFQCN